MCSSDLLLKDIALTRMVNEGHIVATLGTSLPGAGVSFFPRLDRRGNLTGEAQAAWEARLRAGPTACASTTQQMTRRYRRKNSQCSSCVL